jgi:hypothetical protein
MNIYISNEASAPTIERDDRDVRQVSITCPDNFLVHVKGFNYYGVDISNTHINELEDLISACEAVENDTWKAQENFFEYFKKCDLLIYAEKGGKVVGFCLVSLLLINQYCFFTVDEAMVLRAFQCYGIARNVIATSFLYFMKKIDPGKSIKKFIYVSISANPRVVNMYHKNKYMSQTFESSFCATDELIDIHRAYLDKYNLCLVDNRYPFAVKNVFPGSQQLEWCNNKYQFCDTVKKMLPPDFDHKDRGDAWAFMFMAKMPAAYLLFTYTALSFIGWKAFFNKKMGLLRRKKHILANPKLTRVRLIDEKFSNRMIIDKRVKDRRVKNLGHSELGVDRRVADRRTAERKTGEKQLAN